MSPKKAFKDELKNLMKLEDPGKLLLFDVDKGLVAEVSTRHSVKALVESLKGKDEVSARATLERFGNELMQLTIELADAKYLDRAAEMIERVAKQTGISFPHRFERYVELAIIGSRPLDRWEITKATTKELVLRVSTCAVQQMMQEAGLSYEGLPCSALCFASFKSAAEKTGDDLGMEMRKTLPKDGMCEFSFSIKV